MGQVYVAQDVLLDREVALKVPLPGRNPTLLHTEAKALARFMNRSLVCVHSMGFHNDLPVVVMERVRGTSLQRFIEARFERERRFSVTETLSLLLDICQGLAVVHRAGYVHRDIKPDNIILAQDRRTVLMDFGLALRDEQIGESRKLAGSPGYMAPEALESRATGRYAAQVDLYAVGAIGYELLTRRLPRVAETLISLVLEHDKPLTPLRELRPDVPPGVCALIESLLARDPAERPSTTEGLTFHLRQLRESIGTGLGGRPVDLLVVDDDPDIRAMVKLVLKELLPRSVIREATDGAEALDRVYVKAPDIILLDVNMPRLSGVELCVEIRRARLAEDSCIIVMSSGAQDHEHESLHQLGIHQFVRKDANFLESIASEMERLSLT